MMAGEFLHMVYNQWCLSVTPYTMKFGNWCFVLSQNQVQLVRVEQRETIYLMARQMSTKSQCLHLERWVRAFLMQSNPCHRCQSWTLRWWHEWWDLRWQCWSLLLLHLFLCPRYYVKQAKGRTFVLSSKSSGFFFVVVIVIVVVVSFVSSQVSFI